MHPERIVVSFGISSPQMHTDEMDASGAYGRMPVCEVEVRMAPSRWAVLKCRFSDDTSDTPPDELYERLFTAAGVGSFGMVDFFRDVSHGRIDVSESRVFGWFTVPLRKADFAGNVDPSALGPGQVERNGLFAACRAAAITAGVDLRSFDGVVATMNRGGPQADGSDGVDLWGSSDMRAFCDRYSLQPSLLGQEMGHGYGLNHSRRDGSTADYEDPWDVMSTAGIAYMAPHPQYQRIGPGLNAVNMMLMRWFDERRLWRSPERCFSTRIRLRPLHRFDLPGYLAASVPDLSRRGQRLILEFRSRRGWDANVPQSAVILHREESRIAYLVPGNNPTRDYLVAGDVVEYGRANRSPYLRIEVEQIDDNAETCDVYVRADCPAHLDIGEMTVGVFSGRVLGGIPYDGGGIILPGGQVVPIGPWDPLLLILKSLAAVSGSELLEDTAAREQAQRVALMNVVKLAEERLKKLTPFRVPTFSKPIP